MPDATRTSARRWKNSRVVNTGSITQGVARSPNRAMLRAVGFGDNDFEKPIVGVANGHSNMNPCNAGIQPLVDRAIAALQKAGGMPQVFGFPTITDGIGMGTEAMKYSLVSREVIADAIETSVNGQAMDGVLVVGAQGVVYTANPAARRLHRTTRTSSRWQRTACWSKRPTKNC